MDLKDAKDRIECEHPELTGTQKTKAIKALRSEAAKRHGTWPSAAESWGFVAAAFIGMRALARSVWGVPFDAPHWYDALFAVQLIFGLALVARAYRRRRNPSSPGFAPSESARTVADRANVS
ncbi:hypothetical protein [Streptomyces mangrovisoli]|uniref:Uncharacterized protein n=1 Tax=Streptomyces mangrovisoli TaxID=1428628 RepID=A0A1J4NY69_9ACTN|nr:hypothetical protein [Streptomyces mangrovisoli]OIJ66078.1 hypothetical protein WN71_020690 [Streptomyces mangrovisoli]